MKRYSKKMGYIILVIEIIALLGSFCLVFYNKNNKTIDIELKQWVSDFITYEDGWYSSGGICDGEINLLYGPYIQLDSGAYTATIEYEVENNQKVIAFANGNSASYIKCGEGILKSDRKRIEYNFEVTNPVDNFELQIKYNGSGYIRINNISIVRNNFKERRIFVGIFFVCLILNLFMLMKKKNKEGLLLCLLSIAILPSLPIFIYGINNGHDFMFHLMRIEGIAKEISLNNFPASISSLWLNGYGYSNSIFYGDTLLYFPAFLRVCGFSVIFSYKCFIMMLNFLTVLISFFSFKKIFKDEKIALVLSLAYCTSNYRMVDLYVRSAVGECCAIAFLPIIAAAVYGIYNDNADNKKEYFRNSLFLAIGMSVIIQSHILSTEMVIIVLIIINALMIRKLLNKKVIIAYLNAIILTFILSIGFIVPFIDYYINQPVRITSNINDVANTIQDHGAYFPQYFAFFQNVFGIDHISIGERMAYTPGIVLMIGLVLAVYLLYKKIVRSRELLFYTGISCFLLFVASNMFPWNELAIKSKIGNMLSQVQFPWRYISIALVSLCLVVGVIIQQFFKNKKCILIAVVFIILFDVSMFTSNYCNGAIIVNYFGENELDDMFVMGGEYLLDGVDVSNITDNIIANNVDKVDEISREGTNYVVYVESNDDKSSIEFPVFNYKGYKATGNNNIEFKVSDGENKRVKVELQNKYKGNIYLRFCKPVYWSISEWCQILFTIIIGVVFGISIIKGCHGDKNK